MKRLLRAINEDCRTVEEPYEFNCQPASLMTAIGYFKRTLISSQEDRIYTEYCTVKRTAFLYAVTIFITVIKCHWFIVRYTGVSSSIYYGLFDVSQLTLLFFLGILLPAVLLWLRQHVRQYIAQRTIKWRALLITCSVICMEVTFYTTYTCSFYWKCNTAYTYSIINVTQRRIKISIENVTFLKDQ